MPLKHEPVMLEEIAGGAALELFDEAVKEVLNDIDKAAKKTGAPRSFALKFTFEPDDEGISARYKVELTSMKLAPSRAAIGSVVLSHEGGQLEMLDVKQTTLPVPDNVRKMETE